MPSHARPETIVAQAIDAATSLTLGTDLFSGPPRPALAGSAIPPNCVFVYAMFSFQPQPYLGNDQDLRTFRVTIMVRYLPDQYEVGQTMARDIWEALQRKDITANTGFIDITMEESDAEYLGMDDSRNHRWEMNSRLRFKG